MGHAEDEDVYIGSTTTMARVCGIVVIMVCSLCGVLFPLYVVSKNDDVRTTEW